MLRGLVSDEESDAVESGLFLEVVAIAATAHADDLQAEGETLVREGEELNAVFYVLAGELTVSARSESGVACHVTCERETTS